MYARCNDRMGAACQAAFTFQHDCLVDDRSIGWTPIYRPDLVFVGWEHDPHFSQPQKQKIRNLRKNARVTLALDDTKQGEDVVIVESTAELLDNPEISVMLPAYVEKYGAIIQNMGWTPESMAADYSLGIRVTPTKFKSWI
jgi:PPOX class probable F420-dependent enzyme